MWLMRLVYIPKNFSPGNLFFLRFNKYKFFLYRANTRTQSFTSPSLLYDSKLSSPLFIIFVSDLKSVSLEPPKQTIDVYVFCLMCVFCVWYQLFNSCCFMYSRLRIGTYFTVILCFKVFLKKYFCSIFLYSF